MSPDANHLAVLEDGDGPPVVLLHGQPGSARSWSPVFADLATDHRVVAPDRPGYGASPDPAHGLAGNARIVAELLDDRATGPAAVVAHSWSGGAAVLLAAGRPDLVASLVLVGAACTADSLDGIDRLLVVPWVGDALTVAGLVGLGEVLPRLRRLTGRLPDRVRDQVAVALPDEAVLGRRPGSLDRQRRTFSLEQRALLHELPAVEAALPRLTVPTAVVAGEWDLVVRPSSAETLAAAVPGAELVLVPRAGHFVARDAPDALCAVVRRYAAG